MLKKLDIPWLILLATAVGFSTLLWDSNDAPAQKVEWHSVQLDKTGQKVKQTFSADLSIDQHIHIDGTLGLSVIEVRNNQVRFVSSPCRNQICVQNGWISHSSEVLACIPNQVAVNLSHDIPAAEADQALDGITF